jgi:hypothetical protein
MDFTAPSGRTGGDPPQKAVDLVLRVVTTEGDQPNGEFLWIEDPLQPPVPSWTTDDTPPPSYATDLREGS